MKNLPAQEHPSVVKLNRKRENAKSQRKGTKAGNPVLNAFREQGRRSVQDMNPQISDNFKMLNVERI
jgi:ribosomal protein L34